MIRPQIQHLTADHIPGLDELFRLCKVVGDPRDFNPERFLVATVKGKVVGCVAYWIDGHPLAWVDYLFVHPDYQSQGIGAWLCFEIEKILEDHDIKWVRCTPTGSLVSMFMRGGFTWRTDSVCFERRIGDA